MQGLERSTGYLRAQLSKRMATRGIPQLHFIYDSSIDEGMKISQLIKDALPPQ
jgi:ribosome-binding factor A